MINGWAYIPAAKPFPDGAARRSYTPCADGDLPTIVIEFVSATDGSRPRRDVNKADLQKNYYSSEPLGTSTRSIELK